MQLTPGARSYLVINLEGASTLFETLLSSYGEGDPLWDVRADPERFSLREMIAHVADWNPIFSERIRRMLQEDCPTLPDVNEVSLSIEREYSKSNPIHSLQRFRKSRSELVDLVKTIEDSAWNRTAHKVGLGDIDLAGQVSLITWHDGYHLQQVLDHLRVHGRSNGFSVSGEALKQPAPVC